MLLGIYEQEVLDSLTRKPATYRVFIDVGAADGYYAIGVLVCGLFDRTYCFEASESGRQIIKENAAQAGVANRLIVNSDAQHDFLDQIPSNELANAVILMDIEGGEFDLLTDENLDRLRRSILIVELHEWRLKDGSHKLQRLLDACETTHSVSRMTTTSRDLSIFPELREMSDTDRWLVCSEGREQLMTWLRLDPL
jgi:precorrin-6B methylase 2